jgi:beta-lactamase regulating signal transducer with metallopeptidase domain
MLTNSGYLVFGFLPDGSLVALADATCKGALLLTLVAITLRFWRGSSAAVRHLLWSTAMFGILILPVLAAQLPGWNVLPEWMGASTSKSNRISEDARPSSASKDPQVAQFAADIENPNDLLVSVRRIVSPLPEQAQSKYEVTAARSDVHGVLSARKRSQHSKSPSSLAPANAQLAHPVENWLIGAWLLGASVLLLRLLLSHICLWRLSRRSRRVTQGRLWDAVERAASSQTILCPVRLLLSVNRQIPMTWGLFQPHLLLPSNAEHWDEARLRSVLTHELAHVKRRDCQTQLAAQIACALHWLNPMAWLAVKRMDLERAS